MVDLLGPGTILGYCTNAHPGATLDTLKRSLDTHATKVRDLVCPGGMLPVGLWISAAALAAINANEKSTHAFEGWLNERRLLPFTFNGFPYDDFQKPVVKHKVYRPDWRDQRRAAYTFDLSMLMFLLSDSQREGSISTLPLGWGADLARAGDWEAAAIALFACVAGADEEWPIHIDIEPEPGCAVQRAEDAVKYFDFIADYDVDKEERAAVGRALRVCHDICHSAVMFEDQSAAIKRYADNNVRVGKVQISSALRVRFDALSPADRREARRQLLPFAEDRFLHQTMIRDQGGRLTFHEDLPLALSAAGEEPRGEWRIHYHVPIYLDRIGLLETTRDEIPGAIRAARELHDTKHFEVETYAWPVLPAALRETTIDKGIARELLWVKENAPRWLTPHPRA